MKAKLIDATTTENVQMQEFGALRKADGLGLEKNSDFFRTGLRDSSSKIEKTQLLLIQSDYGAASLVRTKGVRTKGVRTKGVRTKGVRITRVRTKGVRITRVRILFTN